MKSNYRTLSKKDLMDQMELVKLNKTIEKSVFYRVPAIMTLYCYCRMYSIQRSINIPEKLMVPAQVLHNLEYGYHEKSEAYFLSKVTMELYKFLLKKPENPIRLHCKREISHFFKTFIEYSED